MKKSGYLAAMSVILAACLPLLAPFSGRAQNAASVALTGQVTSQEEGPMEGVLVSAKGVGTNITITVVSDDKGHYSFPRARLKPSKYVMTVRAVGYEIGNPGAVRIAANTAPQVAPDKHTPPMSVSVETAANKATQLDLKLVKTTDLASQLSKEEWALSLPGTDAQKRMGAGCSGCHSVERVVKSKYDAAAFLEIIKRMRNYANGATPWRIIKWPEGAVAEGPDGEVQKQPNTAESQRRDQMRAEYLSSINLSSGRTTLPYPLKTLPRPKGEATRVIYTEYDLPRPESEPHDAAVDSTGMVWYCDFGSLYLGRLDPRTGETKEWRVPELKPGATPAGTFSIYFDKEGNVWVGTLFQSGIYRFNKKTETFSSWNSPGEWNNKSTRNSMTAPQHSDVDGKVWFSNNMANKVIHRLDLKTNKVETFTPFVGKERETNSIYGIASDPMNNLIFCNYVGGGIGFIDAKTGKISLYPTPTPHSWARRGNMDSQDRFWFGENQGNAIGMFDTKTREIQEWKMPDPLFNPYDVMLDKNGEAWTGEMNTDHVVRLNPKTGKIVEYLLPRPSQVRRVFVDNSTTPIAFWAGSNLGASIVKLEPLQ